MSKMVNASSVVQKYNEPLFIEINAVDDETGIFNQFPAMFCFLTANPPESSYFSRFSKQDLINIQSIPQSTGNVVIC